MQFGDGLVEDATGAPNVGAFEWGRRPTRTVNKPALEAYWTATFLHDNSASTESGLQQHPDAGLQKSLRDCSSDPAGSSGECQATTMPSDFGISLPPHLGALFNLLPPSSQFNGPAPDVSSFLTILPGWNADDFVVTAPCSSSGVNLLTAAPIKRTANDAVAPSKKRLRTTDKDTADSAGMDMRFPAASLS